MGPSNGSGGSAAFPSTHQSLSSPKLITARSQVWRLQQLIDTISNAHIKLHVSLYNPCIAVAHQNVPLQAKKQEKAEDKEGSA